MYQEVERDRTIEQQFAGPLAFQDERLDQVGIASFYQEQLRG